MKKYDYDGVEAYMLLVFLVLTIAWIALFTAG